MSETTQTGEGSVINEGTKIDLKTALIVIGGVLSVAGAMARSELAMTKMNADLAARIESARVEAKDDNRQQDAVAAQDRNRIANIQATTCAIARKVDAQAFGCSHRDEDR